MSEKGAGLKVIVSGILLLAIVHTAFHYAAHGTGIPHLGDKGLSGFAVGKTQVGEEIKNFYPLAPQSSKIFLMVEWACVLAGAIMLYTRQKAPLLEVAVTPAPSLPQIQAGSITTDLDRLHALVAERKRVKLSAITSMFQVSKDIAMSWGSTLEEDNLLHIEYPHLGEPEFVSDPIVTKNKESSNEEK